MSHADTLRGIASGSHPGLSYAAVVALIAGVEALDTLDRVRATLTDLRDQQEAAWQSWDAYDDIWDGAVSDTLKYAIHRLTEALEGETNE